MQQGAGLVGIARLASESELIEEKHRVEYRTLPTRRWLNRCQSERVPFHWTINPYRGCEYGCKYCYARFTHEFMERWDPLAFETEIYAKDWDAAAFREELKSTKAGQIIGIGTATDPYQPAERRCGSTRKVLAELLTVKGLTHLCHDKIEPGCARQRSVQSVSATERSRHYRDGDHYGRRAGEVDRALRPSPGSADAGCR